MLKHTKPKPKGKKSAEASLTSSEKALSKGLLNMGYRAQDITYVINQGRKDTINQARVSELSKTKATGAANAEDVNKYLQVQGAYDPKTLLNPYLHPRLIKARETMMSAVQIFNNPMVLFKSENFCVLANIAWTYLLHEKLERTKKGSSILANGNSVTVDGTLGKADCPIKDAAVIANLRAVIKIRHEVEHTFFLHGDDCFGPLFQACCVNFDRHLTEWFGDDMSLSRELSLALQFSKLSKAQVVELEKSGFPPKLKSICKEIEDSVYVDNGGFKLNVYYTTEVTSKTSADLHKLIAHDGDGAGGIVAIKKVDYTRLPQADIVKKVRGKGYKKFKLQDHQDFWKSKWKTAAERNQKAKKYGELLLKSQWFWFEETWLPEVLKHCHDAGVLYK